MRASPLPFAILILLAGCVADGPVDEDPTPAPSTVRQQPEFCGAPSVAIEPSLIGYRATTDHYTLDLAIDEEEARTLAAMAELAFEAFGAYFLSDVEPAEPFEAFLDPDETAWGARIAADGLEVPWGAGGYFHSATNRAYLYRQPTVYFTRQLFIHEIAHQFHSAARDNGGLPSWYVEGTAEFISRFDWDGECLRLGVMPTLTFEDLPAQAVEDLDAEALDLAAWIDGAGFPGRPLMLELFRYFETHTERAPAWLEVREAFDLGEPPDADGVAALLGIDALAEVEPDFDSFVRADPEPMEPVWLEWLHRTPTSVRGWALDGTLSVARAKEPAPLQAKAESPAGTDGAPGLLLAWDSADDYTVLLLDGDGQLSRWHRVGGELEWTDVTATAAPGDDPVSLSILGWTDNGAQVAVGDDEFVVDIAASPASGLAVWNTDVVFTDLVREAP